MVDHIDSLNNFVFDDAQPNIEAPTLGVLLDTKGDNSYSDYRAFATRWTTEIDSIRNLEPLLVSGRQLVSIIYVYRSVSRAMQAVAPSTTDETAMTQYYRNMYDILLPEVNKLREMMRFVRTSQQFFRGVIAGYKENEQRLSENFMMKLVEILDILIKLDVLKNSKIGLESDFQAYQSATSFLQSRDPSITNSPENHELVLFLGHQNSIISGLKTEVIKIEGYAPVISAHLLLCIDMFENHRYITPEEKFCLLRVIPTCLYFLDASDDPKRSLVKTKEHNVSHIQKILKRWPVVPLCGDLHVVTTDVLKDSPSFRSVPEFFLPTPKIGIQYSLKQTLPQARMSHNEFTAIWKDTLISLKEMLKQDKKGDKDEPVVTIQFSNELVSLTLRGFTLLGDWTSDLLAQMAYKYANPFKEDLALFQLTDAAENILEGDDQDPADNKNEEATGQGTGPDKKNSGSAFSRAQGEAETPTIAYERAVKYNLQSTERFAMVEYMGLIKSLAGMMQNAADLLVPFINRSIHHEIQVFIQVPLRELIRKFTKSKKKKISSR